MITYGLNTQGSPIEIRTASATGKYGVALRENSCVFPERTLVPVNSSSLPKIS